LITTSREIPSAGSRGCFHEATWTCPCHSRGVGRRPTGADQQWAHIHCTSPAAAERTLAAAVRLERGAGGRKSGGGPQQAPRCGAACWAGPFAGFQSQSQSAAADILLSFLDGAAFQVCDELCSGVWVGRKSQIALNSALPGGVGRACSCFSSS